MEAKIQRLILLVVSTLAPLFAQDIPEPQQLVAVANQASDLAQIGPYLFTGTLIINPGNNELRGKITVYRDQDRWRSDVQAGNYREIRTILGNKLYVARSQAMPLARLLKLDQVDRLWRAYLADTSDVKLGQVARKKLQGREAYCFEQKWHDGGTDSSCFDAATHLLLSQGRISFLSYQDIDGQFYPRTIRLEELEVDDITVRRAHFGPLAFDIPKQSQEFETCQGVQLPPGNLPKRTKGVLPEYPLSARRRSVHGIVALYAIIGKDGALRDIQVLSTPDLSLTEASVEALGQWRYSPFMCGSDPVEVETEIEIRFHM